MIVSLGCVSAVDNTSDTLGADESSSSDDDSTDEEIDLDVTYDEDDDDDDDDTSDTSDDESDDDTTTVSLEKHATGNPIFMVLLVVISAVLPFAGRR